MLKALPYLIAGLLAVGMIIQGINALQSNVKTTEQTICKQAKENELLTAKNNQTDYLNKTAEQYQSQKDKIYSPSNNKEIHSVPVRDILDWMRDNCNKDGYTC